MLHPFINDPLKPLSQCHLYTFVDTAYLQGRNPLDVAQQLCDGGSDIVQLRAKDASLDEICRMASLILPVTTRAGVWLVKAVHMAPAPAESGAEWESLWASLTFEVP